MTARARDGFRASRAPFRRVSDPDGTGSTVLVGLTGGIAAGKSTVARALAALGARIVDGDAAARDVVDPRTPGGPVLVRRITALLGDDVLAADGALDRAVVATRVFGDDRLRAQYNALLRPAILAEVARRIEEARAVPGVVVHEIPLLSRTTAPLPWTYDLIVTVEAAEEVRMQRLRNGRGYDDAEAARRIRAQGEEADRVAVADVVLRTDGTLDQTRDATAALWESLSAERPPR
ncbi:dephospho-CoA kinase [Microbacterium paraoxydans]|uniref:dephospho-CoA kinase n=1 Tax=Microbacterium paraoxydans TaxID=199592 RepID=UPI001CFA1215|nr:dephospho-CoA kinase [Microbacterium paraoxydans]